MLKGNIDVSELVKKIEADKSKHIDTFMLSNLVRMVHLFGLKKGEVLNLKIEDVVDASGNLVKQIKIGRREMPVSPVAEAIIKNHLTYLNDAENYKADRDSLFFQNKEGSVYTEVARQLREKFCAPPLEKIRQDGIKGYHASLKSLGRSSQMDQMKKFTGLTDKEIMGIVKENIPNPGKKREAYEKASYMKTVIDRLKSNHDIDFSELLAIPEKLSEPEKLSDFNLDDLEAVERLKDAYFDAVDRNVALNEDKEGVTDEIKNNSKRILKNWMLERLHEVGIDFDANTNKAKKIERSVTTKKSITAKDICEAIKRL